MMSRNKWNWLASIVVILSQSTSAFHPITQIWPEDLIPLTQGASGLIAYIGSDMNVWLTDADSPDDIQVTGDAAEVWEDELTLTLKIEYESPKWSPTGTVLVFQRNELKLKPPPYTGSKYRISQSIWGYDLRGELWELYTDEKIHGFTWDQDGSGIVLAPAIPGEWWTGGVAEEDLTGLLRVDVGSGTIEEIVPTTKGFPLARPQWSPSGGGTFSFEEVTYGEGRGMFATFEVASQRYSGWDEVIGDYSWAPDGESVAFDGLIYAVEPGTSIWRMDTGGGNLVQLTRAGPEEADTSPRYSPSGDLIAYVKENTIWTGTPPSRTLWVMNADGSDARQLTTFNDVIQITWSPSSKQIAIAKGFGTGSPVIYRVDLLTQKVARIATGHSPAWQPLKDVDSRPSSDTVCGTWYWEGPYDAKNLRLLPTVESSDPDPPCRGQFRFENMTGLPGVWGYTLELNLESDNSATGWLSPAPHPEAPTTGYSIPGLAAVLDGEPVDPTQSATITVLGSTSRRSFEQDIYLFLLGRVLDAVNCLIPKERLLLMSIELLNQGSLGRTVDLLASGNYLELKEEFFVEVDEFLRQVAVDVSMDCADDVAKLLGVAVVGKILLLADIAAYVVIRANDSRKFHGQPTEALLVYKPPMKTNANATLVGIWDGTVDGSSEGRGQYTELRRIEIVGDCPAGGPCIVYPPYTDLGLIPLTSSTGGKHCFDDGIVHRFCVSFLDIDSVEYDGQGGLWGEAGVLRRVRTEQPVVQVGASAVWDPGTGLFFELQQCHFNLPTRADCVSSIMDREGASQEAISFVRGFDGEFMLVSFAESGRVDLGVLFYPIRANNNWQNVMLNGNPRLVFAEDAWDLDFSSQAGYDSLTTTQSDLIFWSSENTLQKIQSLPSGEQRFVFSYPFYRGCHACGVGGYGLAGFEFDSEGRFMGRKALGVGSSVPRVPDP